MRTTRDIAWAAGLFEGEGCFGIPKERSYGPQTKARPRLLLSSTDEDVVRRFHAIVGVGRVSGPRRHKGKPHHKPFFTWITGSFEGMQAVTALFWSFLGERRRGKAADLLAFLRDRPKRFEGGAYCNARLTADQVREIRSLRGVLAQGEIARRFGVAQGTISDIQIGKSWRHVEASCV